MPVYFGIPVREKEAFRLFDMDFDKIKNEIMETHNLTENMYMDCYFTNYLNNFFETNKMNIKIFYLYKGQSIIGYKINEISNYEKKFIDVNQFICLLTNLKNQFFLETKKYENNFRKVKLEHLEDEPEYVTFPQPYIIEFTS